MFFLVSIKLKKILQYCKFCPLLIVNMQNNDISEISEKFVKMCVNIRKLNVSENELVRLPENFGNLVRYIFLLF